MTTPAAAHATTGILSFLIGAAEAIRDIDTKELGRLLL